MKTPEERREYMRNYMRERRERDPEFAAYCRDQSRKSAKKHSQAKAAGTKIWRAKNKERIAAYAKEYEQANKERIKNARVILRERNRDLLRVQQAEWRARNPDYMRSYNRAYTSRRYDEDPLFRLKMIERTRIGQGLRAAGVRKRGPSTRFLGCSWKEFRKHIEAQFRDGMNWQNMGQWHIDHIRPLASFDLSLESEQMLAFHYTNHQPLWAMENFKKGSKTEEVCHA